MVIEVNIVSLNGYPISGMLQSFASKVAMMLAIKNNIYPVRLYLTTGFKNVLISRYTPTIDSEITPRTTASYGPFTTQAVPQMTINITTIISSQVQMILFLYRSMMNIRKEQIADPNNIW